MLETDEERRTSPIHDKWVRPFAPVAADDLLHDALETLQRRGAHMARVVDDDRHHPRVATLEDLIEELVGEIRDAAHHRRSCRERCAALGTGAGELRRSTAT